MKRLSNLCVDYAAPRVEVDKLHKVRFSQDIIHVQKVISELVFMDPPLSPVEIEIAHNNGVAVSSLFEQFELTLEEVPWMELVLWIKAPIQSYQPELRIGLNINDYHAGICSFQV